MGRKWEGEEGKAGERRYDEVLERNGWEGGEGKQSDSGWQNQAG